MKQLFSFAHEYDEFEKSIRNYNAWFIQLRWGFAVGLLCIVLILKILLKLDFTIFQLSAIFAVDIFILFYNYYFYRTKNKSTFLAAKSLLKISFSQILLDLFSLGVLVYFTGGIETPIFLFYIFHMIIGSLLLPRALMYLIAWVLIVNISIFSILEYRNIIPHQSIVGLYHFSLYNDFNFIVAYLITFSFLLMMSITLTNKIVSELYLREAQLKRALDDVHNAEKSKQKFVTAIIHELKTPISAASANLDLILSNILGEMNDLIRDKVKRARFRLNESIKMINGILRVSRFKLLNKIEPEEIRISGIIQDIINSMDSIILRKQINVVYDDNENSPIIADRVLIELAMSNLINNAVKYTHDEGRVEILLFDEDDFRNIEIADNGIGIPEKEIEKIFEEYYRASNSKNIEGTGTGLSLVKEIIEVHNGKISIKSPSRLGTARHPGTECHIMLPLK
jgi:signal transduction histidine kinase